MKILHVVHTPRHSGAEMLVASLTSAHNSLGLKSCVASFNPSEKAFLPTIEAQAREGVEWFSPRQSLRRGGRIRFLRQVSRNFCPDVVFAHSVLPAIYARLAMSSPVVPVLHGETNFQEFSTGFVEKVLQYRAACVVAVSEAASSQYAARYKRPRVHCIPNGVDLSKIRSSTDGPSFLRTLLKIPSSAKIVVQVGRVNEIKQQHLSIFALSQLRHRPEPHLVIVGPTDDPLYEARVRAICAEERVQDRVHFLGARSDVPLLLGQCDAFLMPSRQEAQGIALLEALVVGLPAVLSEISGFEYARHFDGVHFVSDPEDIASFATAIRSALSGPDRYTRELNKFDLNLAARQYMQVAKACID